RDHYRYPAHPCGRARHAQHGSLLPGTASDGHAPTPCGAEGARHPGGGDRPSSVGSAGVWSAVQTLGPRWEQNRTTIVHGRAGGVRAERVSHRTFTKAQALRGGPAMTWQRMGVLSLGAMGATVAT